MIRPELREEIQFKYEKVKSNIASIDAYESKAKIVRDSLVNLGDIYSFWIENPDLRKSLLLDNKKPETVQRKAKKGIRHIQDAWYFINHFGKHNDFIEALNAQVLTGVNAIVNGYRATDGHFRTGEVTLGFMGFRPPKPRNVPKRVNDVIEFAQEHYYSQPLDSAIYAHLALALTQPFDEGNKRTARLVQNRLLLDYGYPPAVIPAGEAKFYFDLLRRAAPTYSKGDYKADLMAEEQFFDYIASKVNNGLDSILGDLTSDRLRIAVA